MLRGMPILNLHQLMECAKLSYANMLKERQKQKSDLSRASDDHLSPITSNARQGNVRFSTENQTALTALAKNTGLNLHLDGSVTASEPTTPVSFQKGNLSQELQNNGFTLNQKGNDSAPANWGLKAQSIKGKNK